jgi:hypothetical protein
VSRKIRFLVIGNSFWSAAALEKISESPDESFTWVQGESLRDLARPERVEAIKREYAQRKTQFELRPKKNASLQQVFDDDESQGCLICHL